MQFLSDGARFVRLVVPVISLFTLVLYYLFSYLCDVTFLRFVPLVIVVIPLSVFPQSEMLNALLISSFNSTGFNNFQFYSTGFNNFQFYSTGFNTTLSFDLGLPFLCPFLRDPFTRSVPAIHAILLLPFPYTCATFCAILFPFDKVV